MFISVDLWAVCFFAGIGALLAAVVVVHGKLGGEYLFVGAFLFGSFLTLLITAHAAWNAYRLRSLRLRYPHDKRIGEVKAPRWGVRIMLTVTVALFAAPFVIVAVVPEAPVPFQVGLVNLTDKPIDVRLEVWDPHGHLLHSGTYGMDPLRANQTGVLSTESGHYGVVVTLSDHRMMSGVFLNGACGLTAEVVIENTTINFRQVVC